MATTATAASFHQLDEQGVLLGLYATAASVASRNRFYISTAINYTNGPPHMGHAFEAVLADIIARYHRVAGRKVFFLTGTDEHGQKVEKSAIAAGMKPIEYCDMHAKVFRELDERMGISFDRFIRTTEPAHEELAKKIWLKMRENGDIYLTTYEGWYNIYEEQYVTDTEAKANDFKDEHGRPLERKSEESYFFRMSKYHQTLVDLYEREPERCQPEERRQEMLSFLKQPLNDLCISRTVCQWGVPCPDDPDYKGSNRHVMYVWFDALTNYLSGIDYLADEDRKIKNSDFWPVNVHIIGKDIIRFHCIYWPAMLLSAGVPLPRCVFGHGFVTAPDGRKMSKSLGNVVDPNEILSRVPVDSFRLYIGHEAVTGYDLPFSEKSLIALHNSALVKDLGNLLHRVLSLMKDSCDGRIPAEPSFKRESGGYPFDLVSLKKNAEHNMSIQGGFAFHLLCREAVEAISSTNKFISDLEPWAMKEESQKPTKRAILRATIEAIYAAAHFFIPFIPEGAARVFKYIGVPPTIIPNLSSEFDNLLPGTKINPGHILYPMLGEDGRPIIVPGASDNEDDESSGAHTKTKTKHSKDFGVIKGRGAAEWEKAREEKKKRQEELREAQNKAREESGGKKPAATAVSTAEADIPTFGKIELRVGVIRKVWDHPEAQRLYCEEIDVGDAEGDRPIASGLREIYTLAQMEGRKVIVVCNLKPAKLVGFESRGMVLCAKKGNQVEFIDPPARSAIGERINLDGLDISQFEPMAPAQVSKKKIWEELAANLSTDAECNATWKGMKLITSTGVCRSATLSTAPIS